MRKEIIPVLLVVLLSCNSGSDTSKKTEETKSPVYASQASVNYAYPINYSAKFEMGDPEKGRLVSEMWKYFDNNTIKDGAAYFADTVTMLFSGMEMRSPRDSFVNATSNYRSSFKNVTSSISAVLSTHSTDKDEDWVAIWGVERKTDNNNKIDSTDLHEIWRFNKAGKIDMMVQYGRQFAKK